MIHNIKRIWQRPLQMKWGRHDCPVCDGKLKKIKVSEVVNSGSEEAKDYDFSMAGGAGYMTGNVKFVWTEYECMKCGKQFSADEVYQAEKHTAKQKNHKK
ncbi:MAG: hypothetical protein IJY28_03745 [Clostridia bacterium]|nr:hypothetical protein [Clostridia bacterium]